MVLRVYWGLQGPDTRVAGQLPGHEYGEIMSTFNSQDTVPAAGPTPSEGSTLAAPVSRGNDWGTGQGAMASCSGSGLGAVKKK